TEIVSSFFIIDANQDGRLSRKEMNDAAFIVGMNPTSKELEDWWAMADVDGDGFISLEEYVKIMSANYVSIDMEKERMKAAFNLLDKNGDGRISLSEFQAVMMFNNNEMTKKKVEELFNEVDSGGKGYLDYT
ncbi:calmodulin-like, partial [Saccostrea cucullata]|uniref:calmodulin-like n=1 Tax=Saccostrea cuccullata TaxID=36930 RepID=UPI002ED595AF